MREKLKRIVAHFNLGTLHAFKRAGGHAGKNFFVETDRGAHLIKILLSGADAASASAGNSRHILPYLERMTAHGFRNVPYLRASDGSHLFVDATCLATAQKKLDAAPPEELSARMIEQMGEELARLHLVPSEGLSQRVTWMDAGYLRDAAAILRERHAHRDGVLELAAMAETQDFDWKSLPQSILHGDASSDNTLFRGASLVTLIDWDDICLGASVLDFGMTVAGCCFDDGFAYDLYEALLGGYQRVRPFSDRERAAITPAVRRAGVSSAVWQFLKWNHYEPGEQPDDCYLDFWEEGLDQWEAP